MLLMIFVSKVFFYNTTEAKTAKVNLINIL